MVADRELPAPRASAWAKPAVIYLAEALRIRGQRRLAGCNPGSGAEKSN